MNDATSTQPSPAPTDGAGRAGEPGSPDPVRPDRAGAGGTPTTTEPGASRTGPRDDGYEPV